MMIYCRELSITHVLKKALILLIAYGGKQDLGYSLEQGCATIGLNANCTEVQLPLLAM